MTTIKEIKQAFTQHTGLDAKASLVLAHIEQNNKGWLSVFSTTDARKKDFWLTVNDYLQSLSTEPTEIDHSQPLKVTDLTTSGGENDHDSIDCISHSTDNDTPTRKQLGASVMMILMVLPIIALVQLGVVAINMGIASSKTVVKRYKWDLSTTLKPLQTV